MPRARWKAGGHETGRQADPQVGEVAERLSHTRHRFEGSWNVDLMLDVREDGRDAGEQDGQNFALCVSRPDGRTTFRRLGLTLDIPK